MNHPAYHFLICEDGHEYVERFQRFLGARFSFARVGDFFELMDALAVHPEFDGLLLDVDFRRTSPERLIDVSGQPLSASDPSVRAELTDNQGLAILAALRGRGQKLPVLLFSDIEEPERLAFLKARFAPLEVIPSELGLREIAARLLEMGQKRERQP